MTEIQKEKRLAGADELEAAIEKKLKEDPNFHVGYVFDPLIKDDKNKVIKNNEDSI